MNDIDLTPFFEALSDLLDRLYALAREYHEGDPPSDDTNTNQGGNQCPKD